MNYPVKSHQWGLPQPPEALANSCIDNSQLEGKCTLGFLGPQGISVTVHNIACPLTRQTVGLILVGIGATMGLAAPWGRFAYNEGILTNRTKSIAALAQDTGDTLQNLQQSLYLLANVILGNGLALGYLLAEQEGVCAVMNKTCCI